MKKIAILGITGSIGISTTEVVRQHPNDFEIVLASSNNNYSKLFELAVEFNIPELVITKTELKQKITDIPEKSNLAFGEDELQRKIESVDCDIILNAISGSAGLRSSITTISKGVAITGRCRSHRLLITRQSLLWCSIRKFRTRMAYS